MGSSRKAKKRKQQRQKARVRKASTTTPNEAESLDEVGDAEEVEQVDATREAAAEASDPATATNGSSASPGKMARYRSDRQMLVAARSARAEALSRSRQAKADHAALKASGASIAELRQSRAQLDELVKEYYDAQAELNRLRAATQDGERILADLQAELDANPDQGNSPDAASLLEAQKIDIRLQGTLDPSPDQTGEVLVEATDISKKFAVSLEQSLGYGLGDLGRMALGLRHRSDQLRSEEFWAVRNVNLKLRRGDSLGILGSNGSGKSTLVKVLAGILPPDAGEVRIRGRLTSVVSIGAGFHPHLTGLENIRVNAAILGVGVEELAELEPEIIAFADLGDRLLKPVGMYSSGMRMRLGFAVATAVSPDVMIFDEVLAVGDQRFRSRCADRLADLRGQAATIMVSQSPAMLGNYCTHALWLDGGEVRGFGTIDEVGDAYLDASALGQVH